MLKITKSLLCLTVVIALFSGLLVVSASASYGFETSSLYMRDTFSAYQEISVGETAVFETETDTFYITLVDSGTEEFGEDGHSVRAIPGLPPIQWTRWEVSSRTLGRIGTLQLNVRVRDGGIFTYASASWSNTGFNIVAFPFQSSGIGTRQVDLFGWVGQYGNRIGYSVHFGAHTVGDTVRWGAAPGLASGVVPGW